MPWMQGVLLRDCAGIYPFAMWYDLPKLLQQCTLCRGTSLVKICFTVRVNVFGNHLPHVILSWAGILATIFQLTCQWIVGLTIRI